MKTWFVRAWVGVLCRNKKRCGVYVIETATKATTQKNPKTFSCRGYKNLFYAFSSFWDTVGMGGLNFYPACS